MKLRLKKILVPTDFSELSISALHYAAAMARHSGAEIDLLHVMETYEQNTQLAAAINLTDAIKDAINKKLKEIKNENTDLWGIKINVALATGKIHKEISAYIRDKKVDLIVMGTHGASGIEDLKRSILGSNAGRTVEYATCPVITIRELRDKVKFDNIVLPLDTTRETTQKVGQAIRLAKVFNSTVHVISVSTRFDEMLHSADEQNTKLVKATSAIVNDGIPVKTKVIRNDNIADSVISYAESVKADLILIMTQQESKWNELFLGSSARRIIAESKVPVLSLRPEQQAD